MPTIWLGELAAADSLNLCWETACCCLVYGHGYGHESSKRAQTHSSKGSNSNSNSGVALAESCANILCKCPGPVIARTRLYGNTAMAVRFRLYGYMAMAMALATTVGASETKLICVYT